MSITEDYVSFEVAKLLKEKGFNVETEHKIWYVVKPYSTGTQFNSITYGVGETTREYSKEHCILMPTHQMALKWLREVHGIFISVISCTYPTLNKVTWTPDITTFEAVFPDSVIECNTYEEACETAIKYCLENLI